MRAATGRHRIVVLVVFALAATHAGAETDTPPSAGGSATTPASDEARNDAGEEKRSSLARGDFVIEGHRPNYLLLYSYVHDPNAVPFLATDPEADWLHQEIKFQLSLKVPARYDLLGRNGDRFGNNLDVWFGYTQVSYWQAYYFERSAPFRGSDYEPELGLTYRSNRPTGTEHPSLYDLGAFSVPAVSAGLAHQSNGGGSPLSRSWNRLWLMIDMSYGQSWSFKLKPWFRFREAKAEDDNPKIEEYMGRAEFLAIYRHAKHQFSAALHNNLRRDSRSGYQLDWTIPVEGWQFKLMVHFYNGYGESLIDHDVRVRRIGIGALVNDWKR